MLDRVGDVSRRAVDPGFFERGIEHFARRADERVSGETLPIARLLADEEDLCIERTFTEHRLGGATVEIAAGADSRLFAKRGP